MADNDLSLHALMQRLKDELRGLWRYRWQAMLVAWAIMLFGCLAVSVLPNKYQASSKFFVDASSRLAPLVQGLAVETNVETQLAYIRQIVLSRTFLDNLAAAPELAKFNTAPQDRQDFVDTLRDEVQIIPVTGGEMGRGLLLQFTFEHPDRQAALYVVKSLVNNFMQEAQGSNLRKATEAQDFLTKQIGELEIKLSEADAKLAEFKRKNVGVLPGQGGDYFTRVQTEQEALDKARSQLGVLTSQRETLEMQLRGQAPLLPVGRAANAQTPQAAGQKDIDARIKDAESKLEDLLLRFTEKHPEVVALRATIADLKIRRDAEVAELRAGGSGSGSLVTSDNPVYQNIQSQLASLDVDISAVRADVAQRERRVAELQRSIEIAPAVEAELASLNRDYGVTKAQYESLLAGLQKARISEDAEQTGVVKFQVIDPPTVKGQPVGPKRVLMLIAVLLAALGGGMSYAFAKHQLSPVYSNASTISESLGLPVLGTVSRGRSAQFAHEFRVEVTRYSTALLGLVIVFVVALLLRNWSAGLARLIIG